MKSKEIKDIVVAVKKILDKYYVFELDKKGQKTGLINSSIPIGTKLKTLNERIETFIATPNPENFVLVIDYVNGIIHPKNVPGKGSIEEKFIKDLKTTNAAKGNILLSMILKEVERLEKFEFNDIFEKQTNPDHSNQAMEVETFDLNIAESVKNKRRLSSGRMNGSPTKQQKKEEFRPSTQGGYNPAMFKPVQSGTNLDPFMDPRFSMQFDPSFEPPRSSIMSTEPPRASMSIIEPPESLSSLLKRVRGDNLDTEKRSAMLNGLVNFSKSLSQRLEKNEITRLELTKADETVEIINNMNLIKETLDKDIVTCGVLIVHLIGGKQSIDSARLEALKQVKADLVKEEFLNLRNVVRDTETKAKVEAAKIGKLLEEAPEDLDFATEEVTDALQSLYDVYYGDKRTSNYLHALHISGRIMTNVKNSLGKEENKEISVRQYFRDGYINPAHKEYNERLEKQDPRATMTHRDRLQKQNSRASVANVIHNDRRATMNNQPQQHTNDRRLTMR